MSRQKGQDWRTSSVSAAAATMLFHVYARHFLMWLPVDIILGLDMICAFMMPSGTYSGHLSLNFMYMPVWRMN